MKTENSKKSAEKVEKVDKKNPMSKSKEVKKITQEDFEKKVLELSKTLTSEKIGETLRKEGIHPKEFSKKISQILRENKSYIDPDLKNVESKLEKIKTHLESNKQDKRAIREKDRVFSQLRKLKKYNKLI